MYRRIIFPLLSLLEPETAHGLTLAALRLAGRSEAARGWLRRRYLVSDPRLRVSAFGLDFVNPVGLAAGFDKNGVAVTALARLGFSHVEAGTVTPRPQPGRPQPRLFRLPRDGALINRLGFPNAGAPAVRVNLDRARLNGCLLGVNIGPNAASVEAGAAAADYVHCLRELHLRADYLTINVSSPNTQGLRLLQAREALDELLRAVFEAAEEEECTSPVLVKVSPDLEELELLELLDVVLAHPVAGVIATNTTLSRPEALRGDVRRAAGGLSGRPLRERSTAMVRAIHKHTGGRLPVIGVGGVFTAADALQKLRAGASLVQLYTGFVYEGPSVARRINQGLLEFMEREGVRAIAELVGKG